MSVIKQISVYNGTSWDTKDIGVDASNVALGNSIVLTDILPASKLSKNRVVLTDNDQILTTSSITDTQLGYLAGLTGNIQTQINTLNNRFNFIQSGSLDNILDNITQSGIYYLGSAVTGKPTNCSDTGGMLIVSKYTDDHINYSYYPGAHGNSYQQGYYIKSIRSGNLVHDWLQIPTEFVGTSSMANGKIRMIRTGRIVFIEFNQTPFSTTSNNETGYTIQNQALFPYYQTAVSISGPVTFTTNNSIYITNTGQIKVSRAYSGNIYGSACYIAQYSTQGNQ